MAETTFLDLSDEVIRVVITSHILCVEDLLRLSRVSKTLHQLVATCEQAWKTQYLASYGSAPKSSTSSWRELYKERYVTEARNKRLERKVQSMKLNSALQAVQQEMFRLRNDLQHEMSRQRQIHDQVQTAERARQIEAVNGLWVPFAVQQHFSRVVQQAPADCEWRLRSLEQDLKASKQQVSCINNTLMAKQRELDAVKKKIKAMEG